MLSRLSRVLSGVVLLWAVPSLASAFSAEEFLSAIGQDSVVEELESSIAMAQGNSSRKKSLSSLKKRLSEEKRRVDGMLREVKPLALKAQNRNNVDIQDGRGRTLLMYAASFGNSRAIDILLEERADLGVADRNGRTALVYDREEGAGLLAARLAVAVDSAICRRDAETVKTYCKAGLSADTCLPGGVLVGRLLEANMCSPAAELLRGANLKNEVMQDGTLLSELMVNCDDAEVLQRGAELFGKGLWQTSPGGTDSLLHILSRGNLRAVQLYVHHHGADKRLCTLAVRHSTPEVITWVLQQAGTVSGTDEWGCFPLFEAARRGNPAVYEAVLAAGGDADARNEAGETVLMHAALSGSVELVNTVLQKMNADLVGVSDVSGHTALDYACMSGNAMVESVLKTRGVSHGNKQ